MLSRTINNELVTSPMIDDVDVFGKKELSIRDGSVEKKATINVTREMNIKRTDRHLHKAKQQKVNFVDESSRLEG